MTALSSDMMEFKAGEPGSAELVKSADDIGDVLLLYQQEGWSLISMHALIVAEKSRRIGYTWAVAAYVTLTASTARSAGGQDAMYMGPSLDMAREFIDACALFAKAFHWAAGEIEETVFQYADEKGNTQEIKAYRIEFASGFEIMALTSNPRSLRGRQGIVVVDEASFHDNLNEVLKAALALLMWGGKVIVISTHNGDDNPFNELIEEIRAGRRKGVVHRVTLEDAVEQGLYARIALVKGLDPSPEAEAAWVEDIRDIYGDAANEELDVIPSEGSGTVLSLAVIKKCSRPDIPVIRWKTPKGFLDITSEDREDYTKNWLKEHIDPVMAAQTQGGRLVREWPSYFGQDFGRVHDLSIIWPLQIADNLKRHTPFVLELANCPFTIQKQILFYICKRLPRFGGGAMDKGGNGAFLAEEAGLAFGSDMIEGIQFSESWYRENMPLLVADLEDDNFTLPKDRDTQNDFRMLKRIRGVIRVPDVRVKAEHTDAMRHGDAVIAAALADYASERHPRLYDCESTGTGRISEGAGGPSGDGPEKGFFSLGGGIDLSGF